MALGVGAGVVAGMGARAGVVVTGGGGGPRGVLVVLCRGFARAVGGAWVSAGKQTRVYGQYLRVRFGPVAAAGVEHLLEWAETDFSYGDGGASACPW